MTDALTGMPNRLNFTQELDQTIANGQPFSLFFLDIDNFKRVNDTYGHEIGDLLLVEFSSRIVENLRMNTDFAARLAGDEFVVLIRRPSGEVEAAASRIIHAMRLPFLASRHEIASGSSIGIASFPEHGTTAEELLRRADTALYAAKAAGRGTYRFYNEGMSLDLDEVFALNRQEAEAALIDGYVGLRFRPWVMHPGQRVIKFDTSFAWEGRPELSGSEIVHAFAKADHSRELVNLMLDSAARLVRQSNGEARVRLNMHPSMLQNMNVVEGLARIAPSTSGCLDKVEIGMEEVDLAALDAEGWRCLHLMEAIGCKVVVTGFGAGGGSIALLAQSSATTVVIDCSLGELDDLSTSIAQAARGMGLDVELVLGTRPRAAPAVEEAVVCHWETCSPFLALGDALAINSGYGRLLRFPLQSGG
jgi:diguanylate cyclase (GGDEF)-like protein